MTAERPGASVAPSSADPAAPSFADSPSEITSHFACGAALIAVACISIASCASVPPYNPDHLTANQVSRVAGICQEVMGLRPTEPLTENLWPGDPDPASETNDYRGCIAVLSTSLVEGVTGCWTGHFVPDSQDTATCAPSAEDAHGASRGTQLASLTVTAFQQTNSPRQPAAKLSREQQACAEIGLDRNQDAFQSCVHGLRRVMSAAFMAEGYRN